MKLISDGSFPFVYTHIRKFPLHFRRSAGGICFYFILRVANINAL